MAKRFTKLVRWWKDQSGLEPAEWAIVLGAVIVPIAYFILQITLFLTRFYQITSWITTLPFP
jgi:hypothetical protein